MSAFNLRASSSPGLVVLVLDPATAHAFADAWELANASGAVFPSRPEFLLEAAGIKRAAINAEQQAGDQPAPVALVEVVDEMTPRHLTVVGGESR